MENIKEFMELAKEEFIRMMPDELAENVEIDEATVTKMNDQVLHGLVVKIKDQNSAPTMYMDEAFRRYTSGEDTLESLMTDAVQEYLNAMTNKPVNILEDFSFENIIDPAPHCFLKQLGVSHVTAHLTLSGDQ